PGGSRPGRSGDKLRPIRDTHLVRADVDSAAVARSFLPDVGEQAGCGACAATAAAASAAGAAARRASAVAAARRASAGAAARRASAVASDRTVAAAIASAAGAAPVTAGLDAFHDDAVRGVEHDAASVRAA